MGRAFVDEQPRTFKALGDHLLTRWPDRDRFGLEQAVRTGCLSSRCRHGACGAGAGRSHTRRSRRGWESRPRTCRPSITVLTRYLAAFGPASVMDAQAWCGLTKLSEVFERLRPQLVSFRGEGGRELFDLPEAPRPDPEVPAPPRFLYDFENMLLSYADRSRAIDPEMVRGIERTQESLSTFTIDGFVAGTWGVTHARRAATLVITPLTRLSKPDARALAEEGTGLLAFLAADATDRDIRFAAPRI